MKWKITLPICLLATGLLFYLRDTPPPIAISELVEFKALQRSSTPLPKSDDKIFVTLGDITSKQVLVSIAHKNGKVIFATRSVEKNDTLNFEIDNYAYSLKMVELQNNLLGKDYATLALWPDTYTLPRANSTDKIIKELISSLAKVQDGKFIRNGKEHTPEEAMAHMRKKWKWKKKAIKTPNDFITLLGTKSSSSGREYMIRHADGKETPSGEWFSVQLKLIEASKN